MTNHEKISRMFFKRYIDSAPNWPGCNDQADYEWIRFHSGLPWLKLLVDVPYDDIFAEIKSSTDFLIDHRDEYGEHRGWKSFCIHGKSRVQTSHCEDTRPWHWIPEVTAAMPKTAEFFQSWLIGPYRRVRVMALEPGGYVSLHSDPGEDALNAINIAIAQPAQCHFVMEQWGRIPFENGSAFLLNIHRNRHVVFNDSDQTRYHIIVHHSQPTPEFKKTVVDSYLASFSKLAINE